MNRRPPSSPLFPYTTLFRSEQLGRSGARLGFAAQHVQRQQADVALHELGEVELDAAACGELDLRSEEHTSELQSHSDLVCRLLLEKKKQPGEPQGRAVRHEA